MAHPARTWLVLYVLGQFADATPHQMQTVVSTLGPTGFNVVVLSFLQTDFANGKLTLTYNGNSFPLAPEVPALLRQLRSGFAQRKRILLSIGGWKHKPTFDAIRSFGVPAFVRQLSDQVITPLNLDGIDVDLEPQKGGQDQWMAVHAEHARTIADLTNEYKRVHPTHIVTHAPISMVAAQLYAKPAPLPGLPDGLLAATRSAQGNNIDWLNVQFYEGGAVENGDIAGFYADSFAVPLLKIQTQTGISRPLDFLIPLFEPAAKQPLEFCHTTFHAIERRCAHLNAGSLGGVALWDYRQVAPRIRDWSDGLQSALQ
jgi:Glycosyl hydrolases family 18